MSEPFASSRRQQLDELDALLQRMLALPVNSLDDEPAGMAPILSEQLPEEPVRSSGYAPRDGAYSTRLEAALAPLAPVPTAAGPSLLPAEPKPATVSVVFMPPIREPQRVERSAQVPRATSSAVAPHPAPPTPLLLWPFAACTRLFEIGVSPLGPIGRGLSSRAGKNLLGGIGAVLLVVAVTERLFGWIAWIW